MDLERFKKLQEIAESVTKFDKDRFMDQVGEVTGDYQRWLDFFFKEMKNLNELEADLELLYGEKLKHFKFKDNVKWTTAKEIDSQIFADKDYNDLKRKFLQQEQVCKYIEKTLDNINRLGFAVKTYIDYTKWNQGYN